MELFNKFNNTKKRVAIIGAGASGLSCAELLSEKGVLVDIYEKNDQLGGLASATKLSKGYVDTYYHHLFETDKYFLNFMKRNNLTKKIIFRKTVTGHIWKNKYYDISDFWNLYKSRLLSHFSLIRFLFGGFFIKFLPDFFRLNNKSLFLILDTIFGKDASEKIWKPLLISKFGDYALKVPYSWLRARIKDRTIKLGYVRQGFNEIYKYLEKKIKKEGGNIYLNYKVKKLFKDKESGKIILNRKLYDKIVVTSSPSINKEILKDLNYKSSEIKYLGAICGLIEYSKKPIPSYWIGITPDKNSKKEYNHFLAMISYAELDKDWNLDGKSTWPLYVAAYLSKADFYKFSESQWKMKMINAVNEISNLTLKEDAVDEKSILNYKLNFTDYAQPIISPRNNLFHNPESADSVYFANMHNIYPNDRGQNRAFFIGYKVAKKILKGFK